MSHHYRAAKVAAMEYLSQRPGILRLDDEDELLTVDAPTNSQAPLEINLAGGRFEVAMCQGIYFDEVVGSSEEAAKEVLFLIETVLGGLEETTWSRNDEIVAAKAYSSATGFRASTQSSFLPKFMLERKERKFVPYP